MSDRLETASGYETADDMQDSRFSLMGDPAPPSHLHSDPRETSSSGRPQQNGWGDVPSRDMPDSSSREYYNHPTSSSQSMERTASDRTANPGGEGPSRESNMCCPSLLHAEVTSGSRRPLCTAYLAGECRSGRDCPYRHELPQGNEISDRRRSDDRSNTDRAFRPDQADRRYRSNIDQHRASGPYTGDSLESPPSSARAVPASHDTPRQSSGGWEAPRMQPSNSNQSARNGTFGGYSTSQHSAQPNEGWPAYKTEIKGWTGPIDYVDPVLPRVASSAAAKAPFVSTWKVISPIAPGMQKSASEMAADQHVRMMMDEKAERRSRTASSRSPRPPSRQNVSESRPPQAFMDPTRFRSPPPQHRDTVSNVRGNASIERMLDSQQRQPSESHYMPRPSPAQSPPSQPPVPRADWSQPAYQQDDRADGWPAPKRAVRGFETEVQDFLAADLANLKSRTSASTVTRLTSGWRTSGSVLPVKSAHPGQNEKSPVTSGSVSSLPPPLPRESISDRGSVPNQADSTRMPASSASDERDADNRLTSRRESQSISNGPTDSANNRDDGDDVITYPHQNNGMTSSRSGRSTRIGLNGERSEEAVTLQEYLASTDGMRPVRVKSSNGWKNANSDINDLDPDDSIRPSESASNVGTGSTAPSSRQAVFGQWKPSTVSAPLKWREGNFPEDEDDHYANNAASTRLHHNTQANYPKSNGFVKVNGTGWNDESVFNEHVAAPAPRRWDSVGHDAVHGLERAATPKASFTAQSYDQNRADRSNGPALGIRGASKYFDEVQHLRNESVELRAQIKAFEAREHIPGTLESRFKSVTAELAKCKEQLAKAESERELLRKTLLPALELLGLQPNGPLGATLKQSDMRSGAIGHVHPIGALDDEEAQSAGNAAVTAPPVAPAPVGWD